MPHVADVKTTGLRSAPRQARSQLRIEQILNAASSTFAEHGYDAATTNHIAATAGISVGTLYRWFPDKQAIADRLIADHVRRLSDVAVAAFDAASDEPTPTLVHHVVRAIAEHWLSEPALSPIVAAGLGRRDAPAEPLRAVLVGYATSVLRARVPGLPADECERVARTCISIMEGALIESAHAGSDHGLVDEAAYAIAAYLAMKYPFEASHRWSDPMPGLPPSRPSTE